MAIVAPSSIGEDGIRYWRLSTDKKSRSSILIKWSDIIAVDAFKRDMFSYDLICLHVIVASDNEPLEFDEQGRFWEELMTAFHAYLPGFLKWSDCVSEIAIPAFETNLKRLYEKRA